MPDERPSRTCGNCGTSVAHADVTCPSCGALLAAYEAPSGSDTASEIAIRDTWATASPDAPAASPASSVSTPEPDPITTPKDPEPFDAATAVEDARRMLGMPSESSEVASSEADPDPAPDMPVPLVPAPEPNATRETIRSIPTSREETLIAAPASDPPEARITTPAPAPKQGESSEPARSLLEDMASRTTRRPVPPPSLSVGSESGRKTWEPTVPSTGAVPDRSDTASLWRIASSLPIFLMLCMMMSTNNFPSNLLPLVVVAVLFYLIAVASRFSGRKTTTMTPPNRNDRWPR